MTGWPDSNGWVREDYASLIKHAQKGSFRPEHWLSFCMIESGLAKRPKVGPYAQNPYAPAKGLWQAMPNILNNLGFRPGVEDYDLAGGDFCQVPIARQIFWSFAYLTDWKNRYRLGDWNRAGDLYLCNFAPAHLPHKDNPDHVIFDSAVSPTVYWVNRGLDHTQAKYPTLTLAPPKKYPKDPPYKGKGFINVRDMELAVSSALGRTEYKQAVSSMNKMLQEKLNALGHGEGLNKTGKGGLVVDGDVGPNTMKALERFWTAKSFNRADRVLDAFTRASLL